MGHIGYTPQSKNKFKIYGEDAKGKKKLIKEAQKLKKLEPFQLY